MRGKDTVFTEVQNENIAMVATDGTISSDGTKITYILFLVGLKIQISIQLRLKFFAGMESLQCRYQSLGSRTRAGWKGLLHVVLDWNWSTLYIVMRCVAISPTSAHFLLTSTDSQLNSF